jgi:hypothetical protein
MAIKKTITKEHPLTAFRKANEARQASVKKSLKKAQDGIETNDDMINKPGYGEKKNVYVRPEPKPAAKNAIYQGPVSEQVPYEVSRNNRANPGMTNFNAIRAKEFENASRNPKNSEIQEKGTKYLTSRKISKEAKKAGKQDWKNLPSNSPQKKENRRNIAGIAAAMIASPFLGKAIGGGYEKRKGGAVKTKKK